MSVIFITVSSLLLLTLLISETHQALAMTKHILLCGATGNIGSACAQELLSSPEYAPKEIQVSAFVRDANSDKAKALQDKGIGLIQGNYEDKESLKAALDGARACFLVCNNVPNQVELETNVIDAAEQSPSCKYLVKISTVQAETKASGPYISHDSVIQYGQYHAAIEDRLQQCDPSKLKHTTLRPNYFMQNFLGDIFGTLPQKMIAYPQQEKKKAGLIDTRDIGAVAARLLLLRDDDIDKYHGKALDVCGPKSWSIPEVAELYSKQLNVPIQVVQCDAEGFQKGLEGAGFPDWLAAAITKTHTVFWDAGALDFDSSPEVKGLLPKFRTMEDWVSEMAPLVSFKE